jgi:hypothetical protein
MTSDPWAIGRAALVRACKMRPPFEVEIVRVGPVHMDSDNVVGSAKHVRDTIAKLLGVDDGDESKIRFDYGELRGPFSVKVMIKGAI